MQRRERAFLQSSALPFHLGSYFYPSTFALLFQTLSPSIFFFSSRRKEKRNHREEKNAEKGKSFRSSSCSTLSLLVPTFAFPLLPFYFKRFLLASSCFQVEGKEKKKNHREEKECKERRELSFKLSLCPLTFSSCFWPPVSALLFETLSPWHLLFLK